MIVNSKDVNSEAWSVELFDIQGKVHLRQANAGKDEEIVLRQGIWEWHLYFKGELNQEVT
ncbi:MAG: hypothetical protein IPH20_21305 [Bacteroidales bacterium]|nr:hypothetical protein [Bacteroidales bacterium]